MSSCADRLSPLPDDVLDNILSFIPDTAEKARTSLVSKRFRYLWAHHPSISLGHGDDLRFLSIYDRRFSHIASRYAHSVDRCIAAYRSPVLRSLDLRILSARSAHRWLSFAVRRSVAHLHLTGHLNRAIPIPGSIFSLTTLVSLHFQYLQFPPINPNFSGFPLLTDLAISFSTIDDKTLRSLLSNCPSLTALELRYCYDLTTLELSSAELTKLGIFGCLNLRASIDAPNLTSLSFCGNMRTLCLKSTGPLLEGNVRHAFYRMHKDFETAVRWTGPILSLSHESTNPVAIDCLFNSLLPESLMPLFTDPKALHGSFLWVTPPLLTGLASMLQRYPNLEHLHIDLSRGIRESVMLFKQKLLLQNVGQEELGECMDCIAKFEQECKEDEERQVWDASKLMGNFVVPRLKTVSVKGFVGTPNEMKMLEYLLGMSSCLENLTVHDCLLRDKDEIHRLLAYIPRASSLLQIFVK